MSTTAELALQLKNDIYEVYEAGKKVGGNFGDNYQTGYNNGKSEVIQSLIKSITANGTRTNYQYGFSYWNLDVFKDKNIEIELKPDGGGAQYMFRYAKWTGDKCFPPENVKLDLSSILSSTYMFQYSTIKHIGELDLSNVTSSSAISSMFANCAQLHTIDKLIFSDTNSPGSGTSANNAGAFQNCTNLVNLTIEGCINKHFNIKSCTKLSKDSILSILKALKIEGVAVTITFASNLESLIHGDTADPDLEYEYNRAHNPPTAEDYDSTNPYRYTITFA